MLKAVSLGIAASTLFAIACSRMGVPSARIFKVVVLDCAMIRWQRRREASTSFKNIDRPTPRGSECCCDSCHRIYLSYHALGMTHLPNACLPNTHFPNAHLPNAPLKPSVSCLAT